MPIVNIVEELLKLREQLQSGDTSWQEALQSIETLTNGYRSWQTPYWIQKRSEIIGDSCIQCGTTDENTILVIQHFWHPLKLSDLRQIAYVAYKEDHPFSDTDAEEAQLAVVENEAPLRQACPKCSSVNLRQRMKDNKWICGKCKEEFDQPSLIADPNFEQKMRGDVWKKKGAERYQVFIEDKEWQNQIVLEVINGSLRYLSFDDTTTFCKKCAFQWDQNNLKICPKCRTNYIPFKFDLCRDCQRNE